VLLLSSLRQKEKEKEGKRSLIVLFKEIGLIPFCLLVLERISLCKKLHYGIFHMEPD